MPLDELIKHCHATKDTLLKQGGYVTCDLSPWGEFGTLARITTWPENREYENRSIGCTCRLHAKCKSPARMALVVGHSQFLRWLMSAAIPTPGASKEVKIAMGKAHMESWDDFPGVAAPSSSI